MVINICINLKKHINYDIKLLFYSSQNFVLRELCYFGSLQMKNHSYGLYTSISLVIANMVGTGVFTSLGFQVLGIKSGFAIVMLWVLGGIISLLGALSYSELGVIYPQSGGEYTYLGKIYHPSIGFLAGWISFLVGFAAPVAAASIAFGKYLNSSIHLENHLPSFINPEILLAVFIIVVLTTIHSLDKFFGAAVQNVFTTFKITFLIILIILGLFFSNSTEISFAIDNNALSDIISPSFAISMFFVMYSYSGWNAAAYIAGEIKNPSKNIPLSLILGTFFVTLIYILLNFVFLKVIPVSELAGKIEIAYIFAEKIWGIQAGQFMGIIISILLISTLSSMIITGPRVSSIIGNNFHLFKILSKKTKKDIPAVAIIIQSCLSIIYILTSSFERVIIFVGFTLNLFTFLTVLGVIINRIKNKNTELNNNYKTPFYPYIPILFLIINVWILIYGFIFKPQESLVGLLFCAIGLGIYFFGNNLLKKEMR